MEKTEDLMLLQEVFRDDTRRFNDALFLGANHQADELRHAPRQWCGASGAPAKHKSRAARVGLIPDLLRNHSALIRELQHRLQIQRRVMPGGNFILATLSGEDRPDAPDTFALPRPAEIGFAVTVVAVAVKARPAGSFHANRRIHNLHGVLNNG